MPLKRMAGAAFFVGLTACSTSSSQTSGTDAGSPLMCTLAGCDDGVDVQTNFATPGAYSFEVTVDGLKTTCAAKLPFDTAKLPECTPQNDVWVLLGSLDEPADASHVYTLRSVRIHKTNVKSVTLKATRDGSLLGEITFAPDYQVTPGPNGPNCDPKSCLLATKVFP